MCRHIYAHEYTELPFCMQPHTVSNFAFSTMTTSRISSLKDQELLTLDAKKYIKDAPTKSTELWRGSDSDDVAENYEPFLVAIANTGHRLDINLFLSVMKKLWECDTKELTKFCHVSSHIIIVPFLKSTQSAI